MIPKPYVVYGTTIQELFATYESKANQIIDDAIKQGQFLKVGMLQVFPEIPHGKKALVFTIVEDEMALMKEQMEQSLLLGNNMMEQGKQINNHIMNEMKGINCEHEYDGGKCIKCGTPL